MWRVTTTKIQIKFVDIVNSMLLTLLLISRILYILYFREQSRSIRA